MQAKTIIQWYLTRGYDLQPSSIESPKKPMYGWRDAQPYSEATLRYAQDQGRGLIWRLGPCDLVIDCDVYKKGGSDALRLLEADFGAPLSTLAPTIHTPRTGRHYYFSVPPGTYVKQHHDRYGSTVEFKRFGGYVVTAGSPHPDVPGKYEIDYSSPWSLPAPQIPAWLLDLLTVERPHTVTASPRWTGEILTVILNNLPATHYRDHAEWYPMMCAAHYATEGSEEGLDAFIQWSTSDPQYVNAGHEIATRWRSLSTSSKPIYITHLTFKHELKTRIGYIPNDVQLAINAIDFKDLTDVQLENPVQQSQTYQPPPGVPESIPIPSPAPPPENGLTQEDYKRLAQRAISNLDENSSNPEILYALELSAHLDSLSRARAVKAIVHHTGVPTPDIRKAMQEAVSKQFAADMDLGKRARIEYDKSVREQGKPPEDQNPVPADIGNYLAEVTLQTSYCNGAHLVHTDGQFWAYRRTHWVPVSRENVTAKVLKAAHKLRAEMGAAATSSISSMIDQGMKILTAIVAEKGTDFFVRTRGNSVLNCLNAELWIDPKTGFFEVRSHSADSRLQSVVEVKYDAGAKCPLWVQSIYEMFAPLSDPADVAAHLMQLIGYSLQTYKNHAAWVLLQGSGRNGKSTILDVLSSLAGRSSVSTSLATLENDPHVLASVEGKLVVIDDDLKKKGSLPDGILKKLSENKMLQVNPKQIRPYDIWNTATAWIASNPWPKTADMSVGMIRRVYAFEFRRDFGRDGTEDVDRKQKIIDTELPGVLNLSLLALRALRKRKRLVRPGDCEVARQRWMKQSNQVAHFLDARTVKSPLYAILMKDLFEHYKIWCSAEGIKNSYSRSGVLAELRVNGYKVVKHNKMDMVIGLTILE